jgi:UDP-N-acetyl-D-galactosamine dehydrogenase
VTVLGLTFKEDCPDLRNSRVIDIVRELEDFGAVVQVVDPLADPEEALHEYGVRLTPFDKLEPAAAVVAAVAHREYRTLGAASLLALCRRPAVVVDVKGAYDRAALAAAGVRLWRL